MLIAVAEEKGFRAAGRRLGVSGSAVSQTISQLEERLEVALFQRTTRTVRLTEAGERLYAGVRPALREIEAEAFNNVLWGRSCEGLDVEVELPARWVSSSSLPTSLEVLGVFSARFMILAQGVDQLHTVRRRSTSS